MYPSISPTSKVQAYLDSYPSSSTLNGYSPSRSCSSNSLYSSASQRTVSPGLPPIAPQHKRKPVMFQPRPLRSLTVLSGSRSPSPSSNRSTRSVSCCPPRRTLPQHYDVGDIDLEGKEDSPVVFDANLTFVLGCKGQLRQHVVAVPAHQEARTASSALSTKIADFLSRTDHVMDEWRGLGRGGDGRFGTNIMIKGFQYFSRASSCSRSSVARESCAEDATEAEFDEV